MEKTLPLPDDGQKYFYEIMNVCEQYKDEITFIFGKTPRYMTNGEQKEATYMLRSTKEEIESKGFIYRDFSDNCEEMGLNPNSDFKDYDHLNHLGSLKFTDYFAKYITDDLHFEPSAYKGETIANFDEAYNKTEKYLANIEKYLNKLAGD